MNDTTKTTQYTRLNKRLVELGLAGSRRDADIAIGDATVTVNGETARLGMRVTVNDSIRLGNKTGKDRSNITIILNKPVGYTCSHKIDNGAKTVFSLLPKNFSSLKIAGRLDKDSQGLLILSSDGNLIQKITHPSNSKQKHYLVELDKVLIDTDSTKLQKGVRLEDGISKFYSVTKLSSKRLRVVLTEGKNRQIRRSFQALGYNVVKLERNQIDQVKLGTLTPGKYEFIHPKKVGLI